MKHSLLLSLAVLLAAAPAAQACESCADYNKDADFVIKHASGRYDATLDTLVLEITVDGVAGRTRPKPAGKLDGAPVLGYVLPTTLKSTDVGFSATDGIVALALTSHPDFDDSPIWDENGDGVYDNDGLVWHPHWVVLTKDDRVPGGLAVKEFKKGDLAVKLPPTSPGMPMFMDSPGFPVLTRDKVIRVVLPASRVNRRTDFKFDAVACHMQVNTSDMMMPMLGVMRVYSVASGDLSLPYGIAK
jgi:hypothetical protein